MYKTAIGLNERIHFIGIGGIGMSGLAQVMNTLGFKIQGSDISRSKNVERCKKIGIKIFSSHNKKNINNCTIVVKSSAIKNNNSEIIAAKKRKLTILKRGEMLAHVVSLKKNIAEFPDAITSRGTKHLKKLIEAKKEGYESYILYLIQREDCNQFKIANKIDIEYKKAFIEAKKKV